MTAGLLPAFFQISTQNSGEGFKTLFCIFTLDLNNDFRTLFGCKHHNPHDALTANPNVPPRYMDFTGETRCRPYEYRRGTGMQAQGVLDGDVPGYLHRSDLR